MKTEQQLSGESQEQGGTTKTFIVFFVGVIVGAGGYWFFDGRNIELENEAKLNVDKDPQYMGKDPTTGALVKNISGNPLSPVAEGENSLVVINQPAGSGVITSMIALSQSAWVAVHEMLPDGSLGNILGARRFYSGRYFGEAIDLIRGTEGGKTYRVILHADDGDSEFNHEVEVALKNKGGDLISADFVAQLAEDDSIPEE